MKKIIVCLFLLRCAAVGFAQGTQTKPFKQIKPDLSGTWELNKAKSDLRDDRYALSLSEVGLTILQHDPELKLARRFRAGNSDSEKPSLFYTDGRGETNADATAQDAIKSKTNWDGKKLISRYVLRRAVAGNHETVDVIDEWNLSDDGGTLTLTTTLRYNLRAATSDNSRPFLGRVPRLWLKRVYDRVAD